MAPGRSFFRVAATTVATAAIVSLPAPCLAGSRSPSSWDPPAETVSSTSTDDSQPEGPLPTESPVDSQGFPLRARIYDYQTCGYDPEYAYAFYCVDGGCVNSGDFWGCCTKYYNDDPECTTAVQTTCIEVDEDYYYTNTDDYSYDGPVMACSSYTYSFGGTRSISSSYAFCATLLSTAGDQTLSSYICSDTQTVISMLDGPVYVTSSGVLDDGFTYTYTTTVASRTTTVSSSSTGTSDAASETVSFEEVVKEQPRIAGAIVGGVIGGIVLVGVGTFLVVYFWIKLYPDDASSTTKGTKDQSSDEAGPLQSGEAAAESPVAVPEPAHTGEDNNTSPRSQPGPS